MDHHDFNTVPREVQHMLFPVEWIAGVTEITMICGCRTTVAPGDTLWTQESGSDGRRRRSPPIAISRRTVQ